ncbi:MAG: hypothetical protein QM662_05470 [Gordonia sp. (in: high G+C Gram-positive bacteria)]
MARAAILGVGGAGALWISGVAAPPASATNCAAADGHAVQHIDGTSGCGARAGAGSTASAQEAGGGTAVAVADRRGHATAINQHPNSTALAGATGGGTAYSMTTGPGAVAMAQARAGGYSVSIGGWGGEAFAGRPGVLCTGGFAVAADTNTGRVCLKSGVVNLHN